MREPLTDGQVWGGGTDSEGETNCKNHPERIGFVDLGTDAKNRYPCYECYAAVCAGRKKAYREKWQGDMVKPKGTESGA